MRLSIVPGWAGIALLLCATLPADELSPPDSTPLPVVTAAFSPDGKLLAAGFGGRESGGGLLLWNVEQRRTVRVTRHERRVTSVAFSPDGGKLAYSKHDQAPVIVDVAGGGALATLDANRRGPVAFSPDGQLLATCCDDKTIHLWDVGARSDRHVLDAPRDRVFGPMRFSSDGTLLVAACGSDGIHVFELGKSEPKFVLRHGSYFVRGAAPSPDNHWIVTSGFDGTTRIWSADTGEERARLSGTGGIDSLDVAASGLVVVSPNKNVYLFDVPTGDLSPEEQEKIRELVSRWDDDRYEVREAASAELVSLGFKAESELRKAAESPSAESRIRARRVRSAILSKPLAMLSGHRNRVWAIVFSPNGLLLASGGEDGTLRLWDVSRRTEVACLTPSTMVSP